MSTPSNIIVAGNALNGLYVMARVRKASGAIILQSDVTSIAWFTTDANFPAVQVATGALVVASTVYNTLQTRVNDPRWPADAPISGYNFGAQIPGSAFPLGAARYVTRIDITPTAGDIITIQLENDTAVHIP